MYFNTSQQAMDQYFSGQLRKFRNER